MPIQPNFLERTAFFTLNAAPGPMLDLAGALRPPVCFTRCVRPLAAACWWQKNKALWEFRGLTARDA